MIHGAVVALPGTLVSCSLSDAAHHVHVDYLRTCTVHECNHPYIMHLLYCNTTGSSTSNNSTVAGSTVEVIEIHSSGCSP